MRPERSRWGESPADPSADDQPVFERTLAHGLAQHRESTVAGVHTAGGHLPATGVPPDPSGTRKAGSQVGKASVTGLPSQWPCVGGHFRFPTYGQLARHTP